MCLPHVQDPIKVFSRYAEKSSIRDTKRRYKTIKEYQQIWIPIIEMESTFNAVRDIIPIVINNISIKFGHRQGMFELYQDFCDKRDLDFGYIPEEHKGKYCRLLSGSYLCIMFPQDLNEESKNKIGSKFMYEEIDIWSGHAETTKIRKKVKTEKLQNGRQDSEILSVLYLNFTRKVPGPQKIMLIIVDLKLYTNHPLTETHLNSTICTDYCEIDNQKYEYKFCKNTVLKRVLCNVKGLCCIIYIYN